MDKSEQNRDWLFRYNRLVNVRHSDKQKEFFLNSIIKDIITIRNDIQVIEVRVGKQVVSRNLYIGNVKKAKKVISTYYDTPLIHFGSYSFFNYEKQKKQTLLFNLVTSVLLLIIGVIFTFLIGIPILNQNQGLSMGLMFVSLVYITLAYLIGYFAKGVPSRINIVRNNSSIIAILKMIYEVKDQSIAYAFVDTGTTNHAGLKALMERISPGSKVYYLDSVGSGQELKKLNNSEVVTNSPGGHTSTLNDKRLNYIISAQKDEKNYFLSKADLKSKHINNENIRKIIENIRR